jgi:outer membrane protein OmpA-like peptidoglycan-associated protein
MSFRTTILAASMLVAPIAANAQPIQGLYMGGGVGINWMQDEKVKSSFGGVGLGSGDLRSHEGFIGLLSVGWGFGNGLRAELEGSYRNNQFDELRGGPAASAGGREQKFGPMANVLYDFGSYDTFGGIPPVMPYIGAGVGYQWANWNKVGASSGASSFSAGNKTPGSFAYQAIAGVAFNIAQVPGLAVTAEYRFMGLSGDRKYGATVRPGGQVVSLKTNEQYNNAGLIGVRYAFGVRPPPVPAAAPAPAPAPARSYLVFFDWDRADLTGRAREIIRDAADNSRKVSYTRIDVNGYTDTSGTPRYNQGLSVRRAQAVAGELVRDGVPKEAISITGYGDTKLLVPTGPNVREPQNRRVEIVIR